MEPRRVQLYHLGDHGECATRDYLLKMQGGNIAEKRESVRHVAISYQVHVA